MTAHAYIKALDDRLVVDNGAAGRRLRLASAGDPSAWQGIAWTGVDVVVWRDFSNAATGQILDDNLQRPAVASDAAVVSYRHYEVIDRADEMFGALLALAPRASVEELSATVRKVLAGGRLVLEGRGGIGHEWQDGRRIEHGGGSLWIAPGPSSRLALSFDLAKESVELFRGVRRAGWVSYHVDL